jgi:hypothetical protein
VARLSDLSDFSITFDVEPIVKLLCEETECEHNLASKRGGWLACNLKHISILPGGFCKDRLVKKVEVAVRNESST